MIVMRADTQSAVMLAVGRCVRGHRFAEMLSVRPSQFSGDGFPLPPVSDVLSHMPATTSLQERYIFLLKNEAILEKIFSFLRTKAIVSSSFFLLNPNIKLSPFIRQIFLQYYFIFIKIKCQSLY